MKTRKKNFSFYISCTVLSLAISGCVEIPPKDSPVKWPRPNITLINWESNKNSLNAFEVVEGSNVYRTGTLDRLDINGFVEHRKVRHIISLRDTQPDHRFGGLADVELHHIPIGLMSIRDERVLEALSILVKASENEAVVFHCDRGSERSGLLSVLYTLLVTSRCDMIRNNPSLASLSEEEYDLRFRNHLLYDMMHGKYGYAWYSYYSVLHTHYVNIFDVAKARERLGVSLASCN